MMYPGTPSRQKIRKETLMKKAILCLLLALTILSVLAACGSDMTRNIGVTTIEDKRLVVMNAESGNEFVSGSGHITVAEGEHLHVTYDLSAGSFDLAFHAGKTSLDVFTDVDFTALTTTGEVFGQSGVSGSGSFDLEAAPGDYTVYYNMHGAIGTSRVTAEKN